MAVPQENLWHLPNRRRVAAALQRPPVPPPPGAVKAVCLQKPVPSLTAQRQPEITPKMRAVFDNTFTKELEARDVFLGDDGIDQVDEGPKMRRKHREIVEAQQHKTLVYHAKRRSGLMSQLQGRWEEIQEDGRLFVHHVEIGRATGALMSLTVRSSRVDSMQAQDVMQRPFRMTQLREDAKGNIVLGRGTLLGSIRSRAGILQWQQANGQTSEWHRQHPDTKSPDDKPQQAPIEQLHKVLSDKGEPVELVVQPLPQLATSKERRDTLSGVCDYIIGAFLREAWLQYKIPSEVLTAAKQGGQRGDLLTLAVELAAFQTAVESAVQAVLQGEGTHDVREGGQALADAQSRAVQRLCGRPLEVLVQADHAPLLSVVLKKHTELRRQLVASKPQGSMGAAARSLRKALALPPRDRRDREDTVLLLLSGGEPLGWPRTRKLLLAV